MSDEPAATPQEPIDSTTPAVEPAPVKKKKTKKPDKFIWGTGRRKSSVARVRICPGSGEFVVNKRKVDEFFSLDKDRQIVRSPLLVTETSKSLDVFVNVNGGGTSGQSGAVLLGLARALYKSNPDLLPKLRDKNLLSRDARKVERKKYGQRGARRKFQFSKR